jgi:hypothetical protein
VSYIPGYQLLKQVLRYLIMIKEHVVQCLSHGGYFHLWLCMLAVKAGLKLCFTENKSGHHKNWCPT